MGQLDSLRQEFEANGFAVVNGVFSDAETDEMRSEIGKLVAKMNPDEHPRSIFTTLDEKIHVTDKYFLESSDKIRFFYEEGAFDSEGNLQVPKELALNKVGHALHWLNPVFKKYSFSPRIQNLTKAIGFEEPEIMQSMYIFKQPKIGGAVRDHIDATFLYVEPIDHLIGIWIAIDDATIENGCLFFIPGSHKIQSVDYRFKRTHASTGPLLQFEGQRPTYDQSKFVPVPVSKGSLVLIHGLVAHKSEPNTSSLPRHAYTLHIMERKGTMWSPDNWLQPTAHYGFPSSATA